MSARTPLAGNPAALAANTQLSKEVRLPLMGTHVSITTTTVGHRVGFRITTEAGWSGDFATRRDALIFADRYGWRITSAVTFESGGSS